MREIMLSRAVLALQEFGVVPPAWGVLGPKYTRTNIHDSGVQVSSSLCLPRIDGDANGLRRGHPPAF